MTTTRRTKASRGFAMAITVLCVPLCLSILVCTQQSTRMSLTGSTVIVDANAPAANAVVAVSKYGVFQPGPNCTGTLISPELVLTAAHCFDHLDGGASHANLPLPSIDPFLETPAGVRNWAHPSKWYPHHAFPNAAVGIGHNINDLRQIIPVAHYMVAGWADIMILRLDSAVDPSNARPLPVLTELPARSAINPTDFWETQDFRLVGWGLTDDETRPARRLTAASSGGFFWPGYPYDSDCPTGEWSPDMTVDSDFITPSTLWQDSASCGCFPNKMCVGSIAKTSSGDSGGPLLWRDTESGVIYNIGVLQKPVRNGDQYTITFGKGGSASDGKGPVPNIGNWLLAALGETTDSYWVDQAGSSRNESNDRFAAAFASADFILDASSALPELAVGAPGEDFEGSGPDAGVVFLYRMIDGRYTAPQVISQTGASMNESGDRFGSALAAGDFNGDGFNDLVAGAPGEDYAGSGPDGGMVYLFKGDSRSVGNPVLVTQHPTDSHEAGDLFGSALAVGDLNRDGRTDLIVGAPGESVGDAGSRSGAVYFYPGLRTGLGTPMRVSQYGEYVDEEGDRFGASIVVADFNGDGFSELIVGAPGEDASAGAVYIFDSSTSGPLRIRALGQDPVGSNEAGDEFGSALAVGDFNGDGIADLAIGAPGEDYEGSGPGSGVAFVYFGSRGPRFRLVNPVVFGQDPAGANEAGDRFAASLAAADFNGDDFDDLAIGAPGEDYNGSGVGAGVVYIASGRQEGLTLPLPYVQAPAGRDESGDAFGSALAGIRSGLFSDGLVIGAPGEDVGSGAGAGVFYHLP